ncbi:hypothetical protein SACS_1101 [Parasaccharibacter apium]|uniref:Uncharacterized protein n=1 Tax=Parasaccharibacter apium TaxID=1510841 RepID=A0A7U7G671_9PROT|nr:hypothetical protein SACS_1101 [Parasaccharibacter apium]
MIFTDKIAALWREALSSFLKTGRKARKTGKKRYGILSLNNNF